MAITAPLVVLNQLYFTHLRLQKKVVSLILASGVIATLTIGLSAYLLPLIGVSATGIGLLAGNALVACLVLLKMFRTYPVNTEVRKVLGNFMGLFWA